MCMKKRDLIAKIFVSGEMRIEIESSIAEMEKWKCVLETYFVRSEEDREVLKKCNFKSLAVGLGNLGIIIEYLKCKSYTQGGVTSQDTLQTLRTLVLNNQKYFLIYLFAKHS